MLGIGISVDRFQQGLQGSGFSLRVFGQSSSRNTSTFFEALSGILEDSSAGSAVS